MSVFIIGLFVARPFVSTPVGVSTPNGSLGLAMVFVLLTYGGWNEIAFASAEFRNVQRDMFRVLLWGILIVTAVFMLVNFAYLRGLGLPGIGKSDVVAADLMRRALARR